MARAFEPEPGLVPALSHHFQFWRRLKPQTGLKPVFSCSFRRNDVRLLREEAAQRPDRRLQRAGTAGGQRVGAPPADLRNHPPADH